MREIDIKIYRCNKNSEIVCTYICTIKPTHSLKKLTSKIFCNLSFLYFKKLTIFQLNKASWITHATCYLYFYSLNNKAMGLNIPLFFLHIWTVKVLSLRQFVHVKIYFLNYCNAELWAVPQNGSIALTTALYYCDWLLWRLISNAMLQKRQLLLCFNKTARKLI